MKTKILNGLIISAILYVIYYFVNLLFVVANYTALLSGRSASLSFGSQLSFAAWGFPLAFAVALAAFLVDAGYISFNSSKK